MRWPFSKTYEVPCPDGSKKIIYRNIDDAFPFSIRGWKTNLKANGQILDKLSADLGADYTTAIHGLLFSLDELNRDLAFTFRIAYITYKNDPCQHSEFFKRQVEKLLEQQRHQRAIKVQLDGIIHLASINPDSSEDLKNALMQVIDRMGALYAPEVVPLRMDESRRIAAEMTAEELS